MSETTTITRPAPVLEASLTNFLKAVDPLVGKKIDTTKYDPTIAAESQLQKDARAMASGLGSFQPFLTKAGTAADAATGLTGTGAGTGAGSIASYQSPYQQQVLDATLQEFDRQRQIQ